MGHADPGLFGSVVGPRQAECALGMWADLNKNFSFLFSFSFNLNSNFENLYLNIQSSKNYDISSVGFIIF
jgi:hypothetical protein